jgi:VWFA-related protein
LKQKKHSRRIAIIICVMILSLLPRAELFSADKKAAKFERAKEEFIKGYTYYNSMNYLAAAEFFRRALTLYPDYFTAREYLARSYRLAGYSDEARIEWELLGKESDSAGVKSKVDIMNARAARFEAKKTFEFFESQKIESNEMGRFAFEFPVEITVDSDRNIYITSFKSGKVVKLDPDGEPISQTTLSMEAKPYGIDCRGDTLAVTDFANDCVYIMGTDLSKRVIFGKRGDAEGEFHGPEGICFDQSGYLYIADSGNNRIQKFSSAGKFILSFGKIGKYEGELMSPSDVAASGGRVYVSDTGNRRIAVFDDSGNFIENITIDGLKTPKGIHASGDNLVIADERAGICFFGFETREAIFMKEWNDGKNSFSRVVSAMFDRDGFLYAIDSSRQTALVFSPLASRYSNLDIEVQSVDINKYPLVAYYLTVRDSSGHPVYGLTANDFNINEDGAHIRHQYVDYLRDREPSVSIAFAVDRSNEARQYARNVSWAAEFLLKKFRKNDEAEVIGFNRDYWAASPFDWSRRRALKALSEEHFAQGKAFGRTIYNAVSDLVPRLSRRAVVVITDGSVNVDSFKQYPVERIIDYAREHFIPIYFVSFKNADPVLERIARETGGAVIRASSVDMLVGLYDRIKKSEEYRYTVVYRSFKTEDFVDWWSDVSITVNLKGVTGVEWCGYFVPRLPDGKLRSPGRLPTSSGVAPEKERAMAPPTSGGKGDGAAKEGGGGH